MSESKFLLTRRRFGIVGLIGGGSALLSGCTQQILVVNVSVVDGPHGPQVPDISTVVPNGITKIRFYSASPGWSFFEHDKAGPVRGIWLERGPCIWRDGDGQDVLKMPLNPIIEKGKVCEFTKIPKAGQRVNAYFCLENATRIADVVVEADGTSHPRVPGDCGGGGELDGF